MFDETDEKEKNSNIQEVLDDFNAYADDSVKSASSLTEQITNLKTIIESLHEAQSDYLAIVSKWNYDTDSAPLAFNTEPQFSRVENHKNSKDMKRLQTEIQSSTDEMGVELSRLNRSFGILNQQLEALRLSTGEFSMLWSATIEEIEKPFTQ
jgi:hypothetical protein